MKKFVSILVIIGFIVVTMAPGAGAGGRGYRYHHGHYGHHHGGHDYFWVALGLGVLTGAIVSSIHQAPPAPQREIYYDPPPVAVRRSPEVVTSKSFGSALKPSFGMVTVTAAELNMRSGPGLDRAVIGLVRKGDVLAVIDSIPDWLYIRKANGRYGWVMDQYTKSKGPVG